MVLIGMAIDICLSEYDTGRAQVEQAQLARAIFAHLEDDLQHVARYEPQDISSLAQLASSRSETSSDGGGGSARSGASDDEPAGNGSEESESGGGAGGSTFQSAEGSAGGSSNQQQTPAQGGAGQNTWPPGLYGTANELLLDRFQFPRVEALVAAPSPAPSMPALLGDLQSVRYYLHGVQGQDWGSSSTTASAPPPSTASGESGLFRQQMDRAVAVWAQQGGDRVLANTGVDRMAVEVAHIQFEYFDGASVYPQWNMLDRQVPPVAIRVHLWVRQSGASPTAGDQIFTPVSLDDVPTGMTKYTRVIRLPLAAASERRGSPSPAGGDNQRESR